MALPKTQDNKPVEEKCTWGPHCPICKKGEEGTEDWNGDRQETSQGTTTHKILSTPKPMMFLIGIESIRL